MANVLEFLRGKKTYLMVAGALVVAGLHMLGVIEEGATTTALAVLGFGGLATLRAGIVNALAQAKADKAETPPAPPAA